MQLEVNEGYTWSVFDPHQAEMYKNKTYSREGQESSESKAILESPNREGKVGTTQMER